jgi:hypothetical protein
MRIIGIVAFSAALAGCAAAPHQVRDRDDYLAEATRVFPSETRERVLKAAETVFKISDPDDFEFRYTLTGFTGLRRYFIYAVIAAASGREKWEFLTEPDPSGLKASVSYQRRRHVRRRIFQEQLRRSNGERTPVSSVLEPR